MNRGNRTVLPLKGKPASERVSESEVFRVFFFRVFFRGFQRFLEGFFRGVQIFQRFLEDFRVFFRFLGF